MRLPRLSRRKAAVSPPSCVLAAFLALSACGGGAPPSAATSPSRPVAVTPEAPPDVTAVPEPAGLVLVARVSKSDAILETLGTWTRLPLPGGTDLVRSLTDDGVADVVDLSQPIDGAIALAGSGRNTKPLVAVSVAVKSFDDAKAKLGAKHKLTPGKNGQLLVEGVGRSDVSKRGRREDDEDDDAESCLLAPASSGARLVCGERDATDALSAYLTRTVPRQTWPSDIHVEVTLNAVREPLMQVRQALPVLARSMLGSSSPALAELVDAGVNELVNVVNDTGRMTLDAQLTDSGMQATMRVDYQKAESLTARLATSNPQKAGAPPAAFWHLPADTDVAVYGKGSDPKLFDRSRELIGNVALESTEAAGMAEPERKAVRELVVDRLLGLFTGPLVYGKGYDAAAVERAFAAHNTTKPGDLAAKAAAERVLSEQVLGWHLLQVTEPISKVGPVLKDWAQLWNRPAFTKWAKQHASAKMLAQMRIAPAPAGVALPSGTVHLEITMPQPDLEEMPLPAPPPTPPRAGQGKGTPPKPATQPVAKVKKVARKALVLHILAVPDQGGTWIALGLDAKLLAQKAAASLSSAPEAATLATTPGVEALRDVKANGAFLATVRGFLVFTALEHGSRSPYGLLGQLPAKGNTPVVVTFVSQPPSASAPGGSALATLKLPRAAIEDIVRIGMSH
jgi:hypothetical protein